MPANRSAATQAAIQGPAGTEAVTTPMQGVVVELMVDDGDSVREGQPVAFVEAMKMQHQVVAGVSGTVRRVTFAVGDAVSGGDPLYFIEPGEVAGDADQEAEEIDLDHIRPDLAKLQRRDALLRDEHRPETRRHSAHELSSFGHSCCSLQGRLTGCGPDSRP